MPSKLCTDLPNELTSHIVDSILLPALDQIDNFRKSPLCGILVFNYGFNPSCLRAFDRGCPDLYDNALVCQVLDWSDSRADQRSKVKSISEECLEALRTVEALLSMNEHLATITCFRSKLDRARRAEIIRACRDARAALRDPVDRFMGYFKELEDAKRRAEQREVERQLREEEARRERRRRDLEYEMYGPRPRPRRRHYYHRLVRPGHLLLP